MVYAGGVASQTGIEKLRRYGMGRLVTPTTWRKPIPGLPWIIDNGAFSAYLNKQPFPEDAFWDLLFDEEWCGPGRLERDSYAIGWPDFCVVPDIVSGGIDSLQLSLDWIQRLPRIVRWFLVVQDGMTRQDVEDAWDLAEELEAPFDGVFVGGSRQWKLDTTPTEWLPLAKEREVPIHVGGIATARRLIWAERIGITSVDSSAFGRFGVYDRVPLARDYVSSPTIEAYA